MTSSRPNEEQTSIAEDGPPSTDPSQFSRRGFLASSGIVLSTSDVIGAPWWRSQQAGTPACSSATRLGRDAARSGNLDPQEAACFAVDANRNEVINAKLAGMGAVFVAIDLSLYDPDGQLISSETWLVSPTSIHELAEQSGTYHLVVENTDQRIRHHFTLQLTIGSSDGTSSETAIPIDEGDTVSNQLTDAGEEHWYSFGVTEGARITVRQVISGAIGQPYTYTLVGPDGVELASARWNGIGGPGVSREIEEQADQAGTYYVRIASETASGYSPSNYRFEVETSGEDPDPVSPQSTFEIISTDEDTEFSYRFEVDGDAAKAVYDTIAADDEDQIVRCPDGTTSVVGFTGGGEGDAYAISGSIREFVKTGGPSAYRLQLDDEDITDDLAEERIEETVESNLTGSTFEILSTDEDTSFTYRFDVDGDVEKTVYREMAADNEDQIVDCDDGPTTVVGQTGHAAGDAYVVEGPPLSFERTSGADAVELRLDDTYVTEEFLDS